MIKDFKDQMRQFILDHPTTLRDLKLNKAQRNRIKWVASHGQEGVTSTQLMADEKITLANASLKLSTLQHKEYLIRSEEDDPTGGIFYRYYVNPRIKVKSCA